MTIRMRKRGPLRGSLKTATFGRTERRSKDYLAGDLQVPKKKRMTLASTVRSVGRVAKKRAEEQAKCVPWRMLVAFRNQYIESECFLFWLRSIEESAGGLPDSVCKAIEREYPVFLDDDLSSRRRSTHRHVWKRLENWIFANVFAEVRREGWMDAVVYYAVADRRYLRSEAYWLKCTGEWKKNKPSSYPPFERWLQAAFRCSELGIVKPRLREVLGPADNISADYFAKVVECCVDWDEIASWARTGLEEPSAIPQPVRRELRRRCPGFIEYDAPRRKTDPPVRTASWLRLVDWINGHFFSDAMRQGWLNAVRYYAQLHPHWLRVIRYSARWRRDWEEGRIKAYPSLTEWRQAVDGDLDG
jgi:hypothetical protein